VSSLFITGGSGYIGTHLLRWSSRLNYERIDCLCHSRPVQSASQPNHPPIHLVPGDLLAPATYSHALNADTTVLHLAAQTGKAPRKAYFNINARGTQLLVQHCLQARVRRLVYVSSIAASYTTTWPYYYAESKRMGETAVRNSGLVYAIVRPTIVVGSNAPMTNLLLALGRLPVIPIPGDGTTLVQPIYIDDLVLSLVDLLNGDGRTSTLDLGGPQQISIQELLRGFCRVVLGRKHTQFLCVPQRLIELVALLERFCYAILPVTSGQLSLFVKCGTVRSAPAESSTSIPMQDVAGMLQLLAANARETHA
jgi:NADH dehydrogenase